MKKTVTIEDKRTESINQEADPTNRSLGAGKAGLTIDCDGWRSTDFIRYSRAKKAKSQKAPFFLSLSKDRSTHEIDFVTARSETSVTGPAAPHVAE